MSEEVLVGRPDDGALTERLVEPILTGRPWYKPLLLVTFAGTLVMFGAIGYTVVTGVGTWGNNIPVAWAFAITNFVFWIGIGHAGTFISAILLLLEQKWRTSINRLSEAMTLFAVVQAGIFPLIHMGRPWFFYWLVPYPAEMKVWPQFRSALTWDVAAVGTYFTVSLLFWYLGLVPDLAVVRDRAKERWRRRIYGVFALGWRGSARHWARYRIAYGLLAGLATPLVVSVHSVVSMDFAIAQLPGWHSTIFPPYFVAGAIYSGFAMVVTLLVPMRAAFRLHDVITEKHLDAIGKMLLVTGWFVTYAYLVESFMAWYSGDPYESWTHLHMRPFGPYAWLFWGIVFCNCVAVQALWKKKARTSPIVLLVVSILINLGMWSERLMLIITSEAQDFLPSSWRSYIPSPIDGTILIGTFFFFGFLFLLFLRLVPFIPISELKEMRRELAKEDALPRREAARRTGGRLATRAVG